MAQKLRNMCVLHEKSLNAASSLRQATGTSMCITPGGAACSTPSGADLIPVGGPQNKNVKRESHNSPTYHLLRWPVPRLHVLTDAAAAALDARCPQTFANTADVASNKHFGKNTLMVLSQRTTHNVEFETSAKTHARTGDTNQLPHRVVAQRCATPSRLPRVASATTASPSTGAHQAPL